MANYTTSNDGEQAQVLAARWDACSNEAQEWAIANMGRYSPILPHVLAECFDAGFEAHQCTYEKSDYQVYAEENP